MSKRARQAALLGFAGGFMSEMIRSRESARLLKAEELKEQRLAAIRAEERGEDRAWQREQFIAQQEAMTRRDERNFEQQGAMFEKQDAAAAVRDERNFAQQRQLAAEGRAASSAEAAANRAHAEKLAGMRSPAERAPRLESYINDNTGKVLQFNVADPADVERLKEWQRTQPIKPYSPRMMDDAPVEAAAPQRTSFALDFVKYPKTGRPPQ